MQSELNTGAQDYEEDLDESTKSAHTHTLLEKLVQLALIQLREYDRPALIMTSLIYEYMNLYLHFPSRSLMTSHYAKRISGILHEAGHTVTLVLWLLTASLLLSHSHTHLGG